MTSKFLIKIKWAGNQNANREDTYPFISIMNTGDYIIINSEYEINIQDIIKIEFIQKS